MLLQFKQQLHTYISCQIIFRRSLQQTNIEKIHILVLAKEPKGDVCCWAMTGICLSWSSGPQKSSLSSGDFCPTPRKIQSDWQMRKMESACRALHVSTWEERFIKDNFSQHLRHTESKRTQMKLISTLWRQCLECPHLSSLISLNPTKILCAIKTHTCCRRAFSLQLIAH